VNPEICHIGTHNFRAVSTTPQTSETFCPEIVESYRDFEPPPNFKRSVEILLRYAPQKYLVGLATIVLTNRQGLTRNKRRQKVWSRNHKVRLAESLGSYYRATKSSPATVWLYVDNIVKSGIGWWNRVPLLRYVVVGQVLYHEIGHHIHAVHRPVYAEKESVAEDWGGTLTRRFFRKRFWYLYPFLMGVARLALLLRRSANQKARNSVQGPG
jgi:hypothetical protein